MGGFPDSTYQIIDTIGHGGTGTVYLAYHVRLQKYVILKQINGIRNTDQIRTEVDTLKQLHHPNLPQVYDFIEDGESVYTVMDYIEGTDLDVIMKNGMSFGIDDVIRWFTQLTDVLIYLHGQDPPVIHSDIKPANIIIDSENNAILIDFNIAVSCNNYYVGGMSLDYASPEQISLVQAINEGVRTGEFLDGRSDIYSLCATFSYLMSGQRPSFFYGHEPLTEETCGYPDVFCEVVEKGLSQEREDRYRNSREMKNALDRMWRRSRSFKLRAALVILLIAAGALIAVFAGSRIITGMKTEAHKNLLSEYNRCIRAVNSGDPEEAAIRCMEFLNGFAEELTEEDEIKGGALLALATACYEAGSFGEAQEYYGEAAEYLTGNEEELTQACTGQILSCMQSGEIGRAEYVITRAAQEGLSDDALVLLEIQLESMKGDYASCAEKASGLSGRTSDGNVLARGYLAVSKCCTDKEKKRDWLLKAYEAGPDEIDLLRELAYEFAEAGNDADASPDRSKDLYRKAVSCLRIVCAADTAGTNDFLSLAGACVVLGQYDEADEVLDDLEKTVSENSEIPGYSENVEYTQEQIKGLRELTESWREQ